MRERLVYRGSHPLSAVGEEDVFLLIILCTPWKEIQGFRRTLAHRSIRYAAMIAPFWLRDGADSALWSSMTSIDTALTGTHGLARGPFTRQVESIAISST